MITRFEAQSALKPGQADVTWTWQSNAPARVGLRLVRRRRAYARDLSQGLTVADLADSFRAERLAWARITRNVYVLPHNQVEGELRQAVVSFYFAVAVDTDPRRVSIDYYDAAAGRMTRDQIDEVSRVEMASTPAGPWAEVQTFTIFNTPGGGGEVEAGQVVVSTGHAVAGTRNQWQWTASGGPAVELAFERELPFTTTIVPNSLVDEPGRFDVQLLTTRTLSGLAAPVGGLTVSETFNADSGDWQRTAALADMALDTETPYYYSLFRPLPDGTVETRREWRADTIVTGSNGFDRRMYAALPPVLQQLDEPGVAEQGQGDLRKFVSLFGAAGDQVRSLLEQVRGRHDIANVPARVLPYMARWIGWEPDQTLDEPAQRRDIGMAPDIFETVGSLPNLQALVNRVTRWECRVKEFVHNIFMTNAAESIRLWELYEQRFDGAVWTDPAPVTVTEDFDGRPAAVVDGDGTPWLFWHADRSARRELWLQRLDGGDPAPQRAMAGAPDDDPGDQDYVDEYPACVTHAGQVRLFWSSNRQDAWEIWTRSYTGLPGGAPERLTEHAGDDRSPCAAVDGTGRLWVFWQSNRRGPTDIWARVFDGGEWGLARRITTAVFKHEQPGVVADATGRLWLFWVEDGGDRRNIRYCVQDGDDFSEVQTATSGLHRDESPAAVLFDGQMRLFFTSNRSGFWQVWEQQFAGPDWSPPVALTAETTADKEPAALVDAGGDLRLYWRSQRRGRRYQSRTLDFDDAQMLAEMRTLHDRSHYTYDTGTGNGDWYARGAVGLYLTPETANPAVITQEITRARDFVEPFRPLPIRLIWLPDAMEADEVIDTTGLISEDLTDVIG